MSVGAHRAGWPGRAGRAGPRASPPARRVVRRVRGVPVERQSPPPQYIQTYTYCGAQTYCGGGLWRTAVRGRTPAPERGHSMGWGGGVEAVACAGRILFPMPVCSLWAISGLCVYLNARPLHARARSRIASDHLQGRASHCHIGDSPPQTLSLDLYGTAAPESVALFEGLCRGISDAGRPPKTLTYAGGHDGAAKGGNADTLMAPQRLLLCVVTSGE